MLRRVAAVRCMTLVAMHKNITDYNYPVSINASKRQNLRLNTTNTLFTSYEILLIHAEHVDQRYYCPGSEDWVIVILSICMSCQIGKAWTLGQCRSPSYGTDLTKL